jgi:ABC-type sugar transport system substrate-binding protein
MLSSFRIGAHIGSADPAWVQTREAVFQRAQQLGIELLPIDTNSTSSPSGDEQIRLVEEVLAQNFAALKRDPSPFVCCATRGRWTTPDCRQL